MSKTKRGQAKHPRGYGGEFATMAFLRAVGMDHRAFYKWLHEVEEQPRYMLQRFSRFVEDWEAGCIVFSDSGQYRRELVHLKEPRKMPTRMTLDLSGKAPILRFLGRPQFERMPDFPSLAGPLSVDSPRK